MFFPALMKCRIARRIDHSNDSGLGDRARAIHAWRMSDHHGASLGGETAACGSVDGVSFGVFSPEILLWSLMSSVDVIVCASGKTVVSPRSPFAIGTEDQGTDLRTAVLRECRNRSRHREKLPSFFRFHGLSDWSRIRWPISWDTLDRWRWAPRSENFSLMVRLRRAQ